MESCRKQDKAMSMDEMYEIKMDFTSKKRIDIVR